MRFVISFATAAFVSCSVSSFLLDYFKAVSSLGQNRPLSEVIDFFTYNVANNRSDHGREPWIGPRARKEIPRAAEPRKSLSKHSATAEAAVEHPFGLLDRYRRKPRSVQLNF